ncbi:MAG: methylmalonyl Co-A mutase-associated GTPase MeaB [Flavobacteriaceae bacterium]|nr:methylmalonyl Co-A mutase-associated GTPase MeaB [Flavobacteriaceae bacterium]
MNLSQFQNYTAKDYTKAIQQGNITTLSKAISIIESTAEKHQTLAQEIIEGCLPLSGNSIRVGVTGVPGVGKSTFIEAFGKILTKNNHKVAVLTIDPSSNLVKGSILGDKTRMIELSTDPKAFIRPTPSGDSLGGVAHKTREAIILCETAGFDIIIIETVGVGQNEIAVHSMVDFFLLLSLAGAGDELQGIKRGIIEMADVFVFNKDDNNNSANIRIAKADLERALHLYPAKENGWNPKVLTCSALNKIGIEEVWNLINDYIKITKENGFWDAKRKQQNEIWFEEAIKANLFSLFHNNKEIKNSLSNYKNQIQKQSISPIKASKELIDIFTKNIKSK